MKVYWVTLDVSSYSALSFGCGVTAMDTEDASKLVQTVAFPAWGEGAVQFIEEVESMDDLFAEKKYVYPQLCGDILRRGVWYPKTQEHA